MKQTENNGQIKKNYKKIHKKKCGLHGKKCKAKLYQYFMSMSLL